MYKEDLALNNLEWLIKYNHTFISNSEVIAEWIFIIIITTKTYVNDCNQILDMVKESISII